MLCPKCKREIPDDARICCYCGRVIVKKAPTSRRRVKGTGSITRLTDCRRARPYRVRIGSEHIGDFASMPEAQAALERVLKKPGLAAVINWSLADFRAFWLEREALELTAPGRSGYDIGWRWLAPLHNKPMREIRSIDVQRIIDRAIAAGRSRSVQDKIRAMYSQLCKIAMELDVIDRNYADFLRLGKQAPVRRDVFTDEEIALVVQDAATCDTSKIIAIMLYTGFRLNEMLSLPMSGVDLQRWAFVGGSKTEAGRDRLVPIVETIRPFVAYFAARATGAELLSGYDGNTSPQNFRRRDYYPTLERLGIRTPERPMKPHSTRYTFATRGHAEGVDDDSLRKMIGHADFETTSSIYIQADLDKLRGELSKIDRDKAKSAG